VLWHRLAAPRFIAGAVGVAVGAGITLAVLDTAESGVEIGSTSTLQVKTYFDSEWPEPNVICLEREGLSCGFPVLADEDMVVGQEMTVTELLLDAGPSRKRVVFFVHAK
jgi:hypothetical protein